MSELEMGIRERKKQRTRQALRQAAARLFLERGFEATTIADITAAADVAPRTFFSYFQTKEDVVLDEGAQRFAKAQRRCSSDPTASRCWRRPVGRRWRSPPTCRPSQTRNLRWRASSAAPQPSRHASATGWTSGRSSWPR